MGRLRSLLLRSRTARGFTSVACHLSGLLWSGPCRRSLMRLLRPRSARGRARRHTVLRFGVPVTCRSLSCRGPSLIFRGLSCLGRSNGGDSLLRGGSGSGLVVLSRHRRLFRTGPRADSACSVKTGPVIAVVHVLAVSVMNGRCIHAAHRGVIGKVPTLPAAAVKSASAIAEAIVHAAIETHGRAPVAGVKTVKASCKTPIARRPEQTGLRRSHPRAAYPVIACVAITPVAGRPKVSVDRAQGLLIDFQSRWRDANR